MALAGEKDMGTEKYNRTEAHSSSKKEEIEGAPRPAFLAMLNLKQ